MKFEEIDKLMKNLKTLGDYKSIAKSLGPKAEQFIQKKIDEAPNGQNEKVLLVDQNEILIPMLRLTYKKKENNHEIKNN